MLGDLTTLSNVKAWLGVNSDGTDAVLRRLISQCSRAILDYIQRPPLISQSFTDVTDGTGGSHEFLDNWPVTAITQVQIDGDIVPQSMLLTGLDNQSCGWRLQPWDGCSAGAPQALELVGRIYNRGRLNVAITYTAGYLVQAEAQTAPSSGLVTVSQLLGPWSADNGVVYANGTPLTPVSSAPTQGQYLAPTVTPGQYQFSPADAGAQVLISYSYTPAALEDACINLTAERFRYRDRIGQLSKTLGGQETAAYSLTAIPSYIDQALQPYKKTLPL